MKIKYVLQLSFIITLALSCKAQSSISWVSLNDAQSLVSEEKPILLFIYTDWCGHCEQMRKTTLRNIDIIEYINSNFIPVKINGECKDTLVFNGSKYISSNPETENSKHQLALYLAVMDNTIGFPSIVFLNSSLKKIIPTTRGYKSIEKMEMYLKYISGMHYSETNIKKFQRRFKSTFGDSTLVIQENPEEICD